MGFSGQEYWSGLPCPPLGDLLDPGVEPTSLMSPALAGGFFIMVPPGKLLFTMSAFPDEYEVLSHCSFYLHHPND